MKIGNNDIINLDTYLQNVKNSKKSEENDTTVQKSSILEKGKDDVSFSNAANQVNTIKELLNETSDVREKKIAEIKSKIEANTYNIRGEQVAEKILEESVLINKLT
ncbi:flagellar biosynthesis anti-sigma factor FlgM [Candidatus Poribacteria bacterium]|nr:flagellar biosynthesis anti-sigma factor FlgM [Candidatus Poribacteria bacterium]